MNKLLAILGISAFGYTCYRIGELYAAKTLGSLYRASEMGDEKSTKALDELSEASATFDANLTKLKKQIRG